MNPASAEARSPGYMAPCYTLARRRFNHFKAEKRRSAEKFQPAVDVLIWRLFYQPPRDRGREGARLYWESRRFGRDQEARAGLLEEDPQG
jgi:hypothetical protein